MPRCPDCNKFVSVEQADPESSNLELGVIEMDSDQSTQVVSEFDRLRNMIKIKPQGKTELLSITDSIHLCLLCAECSTELAEAYLDVEEDAEFVHLSSDCDGEVEIDTADITSTDRYEGKGRGAKHFYGADIEYTVECQKCKVKEVHTVHVEEQSSYFDQLS